MRVAENWKAPTVFCVKSSAELFWRQQVAFDSIACHSRIFTDYLSCGAHVTISLGPVT